MSSFRFPKSPVSVSSRKAVTFPAIPDKTQFIINLKIDSEKKKKSTLVACQLEEAPSLQMMDGRISMLQFHTHHIKAAAEGHLLN